MRVKPTKMFGPVVTVVVVLSLCLVFLNAARAQPQDLCLVGTCVTAGQDICNICAGKSVRLQSFSTTDGTCGVPNSGVIPVACEGVPVVLGSDAQILEVFPEFPRVFGDSFEFDPNIAHAASDSATVLEDDPPTELAVLANDFDPQIDTVRIALASQPANGTVLVAPSATTLNYQPNADYCNEQPTTDNFFYRVTPGGTDANVAVSVTCINDPPVKSSTLVEANTFSVAGPPIVIDNTITIEDIDDTHMESATVSLNNLLDAGSELLNAATGGTAISASYVAPTLTLTGTDSIANYVSVLRSVTFENTSSIPNSTDRILRCFVNDGDSNSNILTAGMKVKACLGAGESGCGPPGQPPCCAGLFCGSAVGKTLPGGIALGFCQFIIN